MKELSENQKRLVNKVKIYMIKSKEYFEQGHYDNALVLANKAKEILLQDNLDLKLDGYSLLYYINNDIFDIKQKIKKG